MQVGQRLEIDLVGLELVENVATQGEGIAAGQRAGRAELGQIDVPKGILFGVVWEYF